MGVLNASNRFNFPFLLCPPASLGSPESAGPRALVRNGGPYSSTLWPIRADSSRFRPLSLYPLADKGLGPVGGPYRSTLWPLRRLATYPLADSGRFVVISALIALPCGRLPLLGALIALPLSCFGA